MKTTHPPVGQPGFDVLIRSEEFKEWMVYLDEYARRKGLDKWATRITFAGLRFGVLFAKRYATRRSSYKTSRAWDCYQNLVDQGLFCEDRQGVAWTPGTEPWESDPLGWVFALINIADGGAVPVGLPHIGMAPPPQLRLVNGG